MTVPTVQSNDSSSMQVFESVPTRDDMMALSHQVQQAKRGQARLLITVIFLAGVIAAGVVAVGMMYSNANSQLAAADEKVAAQEKQIKALETQIAQRDQTIASQQATIGSYADFQSIVALQAQADALEKEIAELLGQPSRANAPKRLREIPEEVEWLDGVVTALRERRDALQKLKADVEAWPPTPANPRPD